MQFVTNPMLYTRGPGVSWILRDLAGVRRMGGLYTLVSQLSVCEPAALQVLSTRLGSPYISSVSTLRQAGIWPHQQQGTPVRTASLQETTVREVHRARDACCIRCLLDLLGVSAAAEEGMSVEELLQLAGSERHRSVAETQLLWALQAAAELSVQPAGEALAPAAGTLASHCAAFLQALDELLPLDGAVASLRCAGEEQLYDEVSKWPADCGDPAHEHSRRSCESPVGPQAATP